MIIRDGVRYGKIAPGSNDQGARGYYLRLTEAVDELEFWPHAWQAIARLNKWTPPLDTVIAYYPPRPPFEATP